MLFSPLVCWLSMREHERTLNILEFHPQWARTLSSILGCSKPIQPGLPGVRLKEIHSPALLYWCLPCKGNLQKKREKYSEEHKNILPLHSELYRGIEIQWNHWSIRCTFENREGDGDHWDQQSSLSCVCDPSLDSSHFQLLLSKSGIGRRFMVFCLA